MKIDINELKKAVQWIETNSRDLKINLYSSQDNKLVLKRFFR